MRIYSVCQCSFGLQYIVMKVFTVKKKKEWQKNQNIQGDQVNATSLKVLFKLFTGEIIAK